MVISDPGLKLVTKEHRRALGSIPSRSRPWPEPIGDCNDNCSVSWQLGIPCCHTIFNKLEAAMPLTKWDVHPRWHLGEPTSHNPYRRILDPKIAACLRGRPKNTTQPVPKSMEIRPPSHRRAAWCKSGPGGSLLTSLLFLASVSRQACNNPAAGGNPAYGGDGHSGRLYPTKRSRMLRLNADGGALARSPSLRRSRSRQILVVRTRAMTVYMCECDSARRLRIL